MVSGRLKRSSECNVLSNLNVDLLKAIIIKNHTVFRQNNGRAVEAVWRMAGETGSAAFKPQVGEPHFAPVTTCAVPVPVPASAMIPICSYVSE